MARFDGLVRKSLNTQDTLRNRAEHCSLDPDRLGAVGVTPGSQVRVRRNGTLVALYTVSETRQEPNDRTVRMPLLGRQRLGTEEEFDATVDSEVPNPTISDEQARTRSEFVERLDDDGGQRGLVALAPHGGMIEQFTDDQAERVAAVLGSSHASAWRCRGYSEEHGAARLWHITASEISDDSFPFLKKISHRGFAHAVAFHGFKEDGVLIGGRAPRSLKREVAAALHCALCGSGIEVRVAGPSDGLDGDSPNNIVNRLTAGGRNGVQIEQSIEARTSFWERIAEAVAKVYVSRLSRTRAS